MFADELAAAVAAAQKSAASALAAQIAVQAGEAAVALAVADSQAAVAAVNAIQPDPVTPPVVPPPVITVTNLKVVASARGELTATWTNPTPAPASITVGRDGTEAGGAAANWSGSIPGTSTSQKFDKLADNTAYTITVTPAGGTASSVKATTLAAPVVTPPPSSDNGFAATKPVGYVGTGTPKLIFSDDFNAATVDTTKWVPNRSGPFGNTDPSKWYVDGAFNPGGEQECFAASQVKFHDSCATFTSAKNTTGYQTQYPLMSGCLNSQKNFAGFADNCWVEARIKLVGGNLVWPAFWACSEVSYPPEMDFLEGYGGNHIEFNYHKVGGGQTGPTLFNSTAWNDFHVFGAVRKNNTLTPVLDGQVLTQYTVSCDTYPYFLILNLAIQQGSNPYLGEGMFVDWVKCFSGTS